jgi:hypothetical protein
MQSIILTLQHISILILAVFWFISLLENYQFQFGVFPFFLRKNFINLWAQFTV